MLQQTALFFVEECFFMIILHYACLFLGIKEQIDTITNSYNKWLYLFHISSC